MRRPSSAQLRALWRRVRIPVGLILLYLVLRLVLTGLSARHGFGSPDGLGPVYLTVAAAVVTLRIVLVAVLPAVLCYQVVKYAVLEVLSLSAGRSGPGLPAVSGKPGEGRPLPEEIGQNQP